MRPTTFSVRSLSLSITVTILQFRGQPLLLLLPAVGLFLHAAIAPPPLKSARRVPRRPADFSARYNSRSTQIPAVFLFVPARWSILPASTGHCHHRHFASVVVPQRTQFRPCQRFGNGEREGWGAGGKGRPRCETSDPNLVPNNKSAIMFLVAQYLYLQLTQHGHTTACRW